MRADARRTASLLLALAMGAGCSNGATSPPGSVVPSPTVAGASPSSLPPSAPPSPSASPAAAGTRVQLSGSGPLGLEVVDGRAWVVAADSGQLIGVDLAARREVQALQVGGGGTHVAVAPGARLAVARTGSQGADNYLLVVDPASGKVDAVTTNPLEDVDAGDAGRLWALEKSGRILLLDGTSARVVGSVTIPVGSNEHMEAVWAQGSLWVSSDSTPVRRISGTKPKVVGQVDPGGGIPLAVSDGLVWGARADEVWAIDPRTTRVARRVPLSDVIEILAMDVDGGEAWIAARRPGRIGTVLHVDLAGGALLAEFPVSLPAGVRITPERVWVTSYDTNELLGFAP